MRRNTLHDLESIKDPLLNPNQAQDDDLCPENDDKRSKSDALIKIFRLSIAPIIGMIFHPMYHIINTMLLG